MHKWIITILSFFVQISALDVQAYDNKLTHTALTESAVEEFLIGNGRYLTRNLGAQFSEGQFLELNGKTVLEWFQDGSDFEDGDESDLVNGNQCRAANHFHNPLKPWDEAEMSDGRLTVRGAYVNQHCEKDDWEYADRRSSLIWATDYIEPAPDGDKQQSDRQEWDWNRARESYEQALVSALPEEQDTGFTEAFRALGHVIHLIQDGAQPAHVRNDFESHLTWTNLKVDFKSENFIKDWFGSQYEYYVKVHTKKLVQTAVPAKPVFENPSLTDFWDTDTYLGDNPSNSMTLGITELVNANYFSDKTLPRQKWRIRRPQFPTLATYDEADFHKFPNPTLTNEDARVCSGPFWGDRPEKVRRYIVRKGKGDCSEESYIAAAEVLVTPSFTNEPASMQAGDVEKLDFHLDFKIYQAYAEKLLPMAIGYSSALIDYFFRGELGIIHHPEGLIIKNNNEEEMASYTDEEGNDVGKISIYYDSGNNDRMLLADYEFKAVLSPGGKTSIIKFAKPQDNIIPGRYIIVFKGRLGKEEGAVIGKVASPRIYYVSQRLDAESGEHHEKIIRMEADGRNKTIIYDNQDPNFLIGKISLSPDSSQLVFQAQNLPDEEPQLYLLDIAKYWEPDSPEPTLLTEGRWPSWSPDGDSIVFQRGNHNEGIGFAFVPNGTAYLYSIDLDGKTVSQLRGGERTDFHPAWSPDGDQVAYVTNASDEVAPKQEPGAVECGNNVLSLEYLTDRGSYGGSITYCLNEFSRQISTQDPSSISIMPNSPVWNPDGKEMMYLAGYWYYDHDHYFYGQPFKVNVVANVDNPVEQQIETALYDLSDSLHIPYLGSSSWSPGGTEIATTYYFYEDENADTDIMLLDAVNGGFDENLTVENLMNDSYPVYGY